MTALGIVLESTPATGGSDPAELARAAERAGLDLVVVQSGTGTGPAGLDGWTVATWLAAATSRISVGVDASAPLSPGSADHTDPEAPNPAVVAKAHDSLGVLEGSRLVTTGWVTATATATATEVRALAATGATVVVPAASPADVERVAGLLPERPISRRTAAARSQRRPGIAYDEVPASLADDAVEPGDPAYPRVRSTYMRGGSPGLVLRPRTVAAVSDAIGFARQHRDLPLGIRSGGHGISGRSTNAGGLVIDVGALDRIEVIDADRRRVRIGPGATWKQVAAALDPHGWALSSGDYGGVGVGGLATAGGIGLLGRAHGLTIDHLRAVELVLADGSAVRASADENPDLFWAVRGAGANFGIATAFEFTVAEVAEVGWAQLTFVTTDLEAALLAYGRIQSRAPRDTTIFLITSPPQQGQWVVRLYGMVDSTDPDTVIARLTPFLELGDLVQQQVMMSRYRDVMATAADVGADGHHGAGQPAARSGFLDTLTPGFAHAAVDALAAGGFGWFQLRAMGGAIADVPSGEMAFSHRDPGFHVTAMGSGERAITAAWAPLSAHTTGLYLSFDTDRGAERVAEAFPPPVLARLRDLKGRYDPDSLFHDNFPIAPLAQPAGASVGADLGGPA